MESMKHKAIVQVFRSCPRFAPELLRLVFAVKLPAYTLVQRDATDFGKEHPPDYRADAVVQLVATQPVGGCMVEAQCSYDASKPYIWPAYMGNFRARIRSDVYLLVISPDEGLAAWCARTITMGHPGFQLKPLVLGPEQVPVVTSLEEARKSPALAALSVIFYGETQHGMAIRKAVVQLAQEVDDEEARRLYLDLAFACLPMTFHKELEELMDTDDDEFLSDWMKERYAVVKEQLMRENFEAGLKEGETRGRNQGLKEGETRGRNQGLKEGLKEGETRGRNEGLKEGENRGLRGGRAASILRILAVRGISLSDLAKKRILTCADIAMLDCWIDRSVVVQGEAELFDVASPA